jgi:hypothetical protein
VKNNIKEEITNIIHVMGLDCTLEELQDKDKVDWLCISHHQTLSEELIREFQDKINWGVISGHQTLSEDFIREFQNTVDWLYISWKQTLSENLIREFQNTVDWSSISSNQTLSEDFIREFQDKVDWRVIFKNQDVSVDFAIENIHLLLNDNLSKKCGKKINELIRFKEKEIQKYNQCVKNNIEHNNNAIDFLEI